MLEPGRFARFVAKKNSQNTELGTQPPWPGLSRFVKEDFTHQ